MNKSPYSTYAEYLAHPTFRAIRKQVMEAANWTCKRCKKSAGYRGASRSLSQMGNV